MGHPAEAALAHLMLQPLGFSRTFPVSACFEIAIGIATGSGSGLLIPILNRKLPETRKSNVACKSVWPGEAVPSCSVWHHAKRGCKSNQRTALRAETSAWRRDGARGLFERHICCHGVYCLSRRRSMNPAIAATSSGLKVGRSVSISTSVTNAINRGSSRHTG